MVRIGVTLADGFEEIEAVSIIDVLRRANMDVKVISVANNLVVKGAHNITLVADQLFDETKFGTFDMVILPGGMPGSINLKNNAGLQTEILNFHQNGKYLGAICAAPLVFGHLGILKNRTATCYPGFEDQLLGANVTENSVEVDGNIVTGKGAGVAIEFALKIVEVFKGKSFTDELGRKMIAT